MRRPVLLLRPLMRYADFKGRASRAEYWLFMAFQGALYGACIVFGLISLGGPDMGAGILRLMGWVAVAGLLVLALALPNYALLARRLHDIGLSALWMLLLLPNVASQFAAFRMMGSAAKQAMDGGAGGGEALKQAMAGEMASVGVLVIVASISSFALFVMTVLPGKRGANRFGPDPKDPDGLVPPETGPDGRDDDRWDALIAEAKQAARADEPPYKPVFDFGPGPAAQPAARAAVPPAPAPQTQAWSPYAEPARPFGRRT